jgi:hypothetical protein
MPGEVKAMKTAMFRHVVPLLALALLAGPAAAQKLYKWVDDQGRVHYGDKVPPEYADQDREILNQRGVAIGREQGAETPAAAQARVEQENKAKAAAEQAQRDRMLLQTYQNVEEIELLRARRLDLIDAQLTIHEQSLANLKQRHADQLRLAQRYAPQNTAANAPPMPEGLVADLARSESDVRVQEGNLARKREERNAIDRQFDADKERFKQLRRIQ